MSDSSPSRMAKVGVAEDGDVEVEAMEVDEATRPEETQNHQGEEEAMMDGQGKGQGVTHSEDMQEGASAGRTERGQDVEMEETVTDADVLASTSSSSSPPPPPPPPPPTSSSSSSSSSSAAAAVKAEEEGDGGEGEDEEDTDTLLQQMIAEREEFYDKQIEELSMEIENVKKSTHPGYLEQEVGLKRIMDSRIEEARRFRDLQVESIERQFEVEKKQADDDFENEKRNLRDRIMSEIESRQKKLELQKKANIEECCAELRPTRRLRSRRQAALQQQESSVASVAQQPQIPAQPFTMTRKRAPDMQIILKLTDAEIQEDMKEFKNIVDSSSKSRIRKR